jgi:hypothetical protein
MGPDGVLTAVQTALPDTHESTAHAGVPLHGGAVARAVPSLRQKCPRGSSTTL